MNAMNPIVIDPHGFDQAGGLAHEDGEPNWRAAFGADPGCCSCPACGETYWALGRRQRCVKCAFEYPTDWWPMYSWGSQAAGRKQVYQHAERMKHPYYRHGFENPVEDPWKEHHTEKWRADIRAKFGGKETP